MEGTWKTTGGGGSGFGDLLAVAGVILLLAVAAGPVMAAVGELVHVLFVIGAVLLGVAAAALVACVAFRMRRRRLGGITRVSLAPPAPQRAARALPEPRPAIEPAPEVHVHHHWHGVDAEDVAAIIRRQQD